MNGFKTTGIWPPNKDVYPDSAYAAAENLSEQPQNTPDIPICDPAKVPKDPKEPGTRNVPTTPTTSSMVSTSGLKITIQQISPIPSNSNCGKIKKAKGATKAILLTSSPYKEELLSAKERKRAQEERTAGNKAKRALKLLQKETPENPPAKKKKLNKQATEDWYCHICEEKSVEDMIQCLNCKVWAHDKCAGVNSGKKQFFCPECQ
ncbi:PHD-finger [Popillia japonica]|uniref:PHD-finger n=1 Tax=Popillia japonica TaxID=7064 RepID=A0AAW1JBF2_POPJA